MRRLSGFVLLALTSVEAFAQTTERVSVNSAGERADACSYVSAISGNGRFVAFESDAMNLVAGTAPFTRHVFLHDRQTGETSIADAAALSPEQSSAMNPSLSFDGRFVAFDSYANNLVPNDSNDRVDVFVRDRLTGTIERVSVTSQGGQGNRESTNPSLSADGRFVAFESTASNLVPGDTNARSDVFVHDRSNGETTRVSVDSFGAEGNAGSFRPCLSADGRFVAFDSLATQLVPGDTNQSFDTFVHDRVTGETTRVSTDSAGSEGNGDSGVFSRPALSSEGRFVAFASSATNLVSGDTNGDWDMFVHDRATGETQRVSVSSQGQESEAPLFLPGSRDAAISADGRFVAFFSHAANLVAEGTHLCNDEFDKYPCGNAYVHDRATGETSRASVDSAGRELYEECRFAPALSADGRFVAFDKAREIYERDRFPCGAGTVGDGAAMRTPVLFVNDSASLSTAAIGEPITVRLDASPFGPSSARYLLWIWGGLPIRQSDLVVRGASMGCTVDPSPFSGSRAPQPLLCLRGGIPASACGRAHPIAAPSRAPWSATRASGFDHRITLTLQGVVADDGAASSLHYSVTNSVIVLVE
jgi:WD40 repeat protein